MLIFDIGSNVGRWALTNYPNDIICVEASPNTYRTLCSNTRNYPTITCLNYVVTNDTNPMVDFYECIADAISTLDKDWLTHESSRFYDYRFNINKVSLPTITIDKLIDLYGTPHLIKIDVEGAENIVLKSLTKQVSQLCFEWASEWNVKTFECIDYLESLGYRKFSIQDADEYSYRPSQYEYTGDEIKSILLKTTPKLEWGMIWTHI